MPQISVLEWMAGFSGLVAALVGLYLASRLNKLTRGGVIGSSIGYVIFGFAILAIAALFDQLLPYLWQVLPADAVPFTIGDFALGRQMMQLTAMVLFAVYFYRVHRAFAGYVAQHPGPAAPKSGAAHNVDETMAAAEASGAQSLEQA